MLTFKVLDVSTSSQDNACLGKLPMGGQCRTEGKIFTPNFPDYYSKNKNCAWEIKVDEGDVIYLSFVSSQIKCNTVGDAPTGDYMVIFDGVGDCSQPLQQTKNRLTLVCEQFTPQHIFSTTNAVHICFHSNEDADTGLGVVLTWRASSKDDYCRSYYRHYCACAKDEVCEHEWVQVTRDSSTTLNAFQDSISTRIMTVEDCQQKCIDSGVKEVTKMCHTVYYEHEKKLCYLYYTNAQKIFENKVNGDYSRITKTLSNFKGSLYQRVCVCRKQCSTFPTGKGGTVNTTSTKESAVVQHSCKSGFKFPDGSLSKTVTCLRNKEWSDKDVCTDIYECDNETIRSHCGDAECVNKEGSYDCSCPRGLNWSLGFCSDIDECSNQLETGCKDPRICKNTNGSFDCRCYQNGTFHVDKKLCTTVCKIGFYGSECQHACGCKGRMPCNIITGVCSNGCDDEFEGSTCERNKCPARYWGPHCNFLCYCKDFAECDVKTGKCPNGSCERDWHGESCNMQGRDGCQAYRDTNGIEPCQNKGVCIDWLDNVGSMQFICICQPGTYGFFCEFHKDECEEWANTLCTSQQTCIDKINGYACEGL